MSEHLAPSARKTLAGWHDFVATGNADLLTPLLSEHIVFRSPFVQSPIPGRAATLLVLTTVVQIFENFRYHRSFIAGPHDGALEFADIGGKFQRGVVGARDKRPVVGEILENPRHRRQHQHGRRPPRNRRMHEW